MGSALEFAVSYLKPEDRRKYECTIGHVAHINTIYPLFPTWFDDESITLSSNILY